jgi:hypothetical protein
LTGILPVPDALVAEGGRATMRIVAPTNIEIDQIFVADLGGDAPAIQECNLTGATHSVSGDCTTTIAGDDGAYVGLGPGQGIDLSFSAPDLVEGLVRDFAFVTEGQYGTDRDDYGQQPVAPPGAVADVRVFPNPFVASTTIRFDVPAPGGRVSVRVYDLSGRLVRTLGDDDLGPGSYELGWDARNEGGNRVAAGVYFYRIELSGAALQRKLVVLR